jgi:AraC-like DNA-binding protein
MMKYLLIFISFISFAQKTILVSELSKMNYPELADLYFKKDTLSKIVIADFFLQKAKKENHHFNISLGFIYKSQMAIKEDLIEKYIDSALNNSKRYLPNSYLLAYSYYTKANFFFDKRKYNIALNNYILANKFLDKEDHERLYYDIQFIIAVINSSLFNYEEALPIFIESHKYSLKSNGKPDTGVVFAIAESCNRLDKIKLAQYYTNYGKKWCKILNEDPNIFLSCEGINYYKLKKYIYAIQLLKKTLKSTKEDFANYATNCLYIGKSYVAIGDTKMGVVYFKKVDSVFVKEKNITVERIACYKYLLSYYKEKNDPKNQLLYTNNLIKADSTLMSNYNYLTKKIHTEYDIPELLKNKESLINELKIEKKYYLFLFIVITIGLFYLFIRYQKKQKQLQFDQQEIFKKYKEAQFKTITNKEKTVNLEKIELTVSSTIIHQDLASELMYKLIDFENKKRYLDKNCTLDKVAKEMNTNTTYLSKIINEKKGVNFSNYINSLRIEYAADRLENDESFIKYNMRGIADAVGFNNADSFARAFKTHLNMTPSFFIEQLKN